jgi:hypothetical protein
MVNTYLLIRVLYTMEIDEDCVISNERYDSFQPSSRRQVSVDAVQDFYGRGLLTQG